MFVTENGGFSKTPSRMKGFENGRGRVKTEVFENAYVIAHLMLACENKQFNIEDNFVFIGFQLDCYPGVKCCSF